APHGPRPAHPRRGAGPTTPGGPPTSAPATISAAPAPRPAVEPKASAADRHSPRLDNRRVETTSPPKMYAISTDCACFTVNLSAVGADLIVRGGSTTCMPKLRTAPLAPPLLGPFPAPLPR